MHWIQVISLFLANASLIFWFRSEARSDARQAMDNHRHCVDLITAIHQEIKDFHGRLCAIEERHKKND